MIEVKDLVKRYGNAEALRGICFEVHCGEIVAVAGLDGSGKSTLTDILAGSMDMDGGQVLIEGVDLMEHPAQARQHLGYVPARPALYRDMTPRGCMKFVAEARGMSNREMSEKIDEAVRQFRLKDVADTPVRNLAESVKRMATLAQAAFTGAEVLLIDEPTEGLNPREILEMRQMIEELKPSHAILLTSKNITEICALADRVLVMQDGKIIARGTPSQLHRMMLADGSLRVTIHASEEDAKRVLSALPNVDVKTVGTESGECTLIVVPKDGRDMRREVFQAVCAASLTLLEMTPEGKPLDEWLSKMVSERLSAQYESDKEENEP